MPPPTLKEQLEILKHYEIPLEKLTCYECQSWNNCEYALDPYNTCGECLQAK